MDKETLKFTKTTQDDSMHHGSNSSTTIEKKIVSSKQTSLVNVKDSNDNNASLRDGPTAETRQSLSSQAKQKKHGDPSLKNSTVDKRAIDNKPSTVSDLINIINKQLCCQVDHFCCYF